MSDVCQLKSTHNQPAVIYSCLSSRYSDRRSKQDVTIQRLCASARYGLCCLDCFVQWKTSTVTLVMVPILLVQGFLQVVCVSTAVLASDPAYKSIV